MTDIEQAGAKDTTSSLIEQLGNAFLDLHARKDAFEDEVQWTEVEEHFRNLETLLKEKFEQLEAKEKEFEEKETETRLLIAEREAAVAAKEQDLLDRVQELKDSAVTAIAEARSVHQPTSVEAVDDGDNKDGKSYLKDLRRNSQGKGGNSEGVGGSQNEVNAQELAALKAVIRCIEEFKLEADYPLDPLQKRVAQLEKSKTDKKRGGDFGRRQQSKKPRANGGFRGFRAPVASAATAGRQGPPAFVERAAYTGMSERFPHAGMATYDYQVPSQPAYVQQANDQRLYYYPQDDRVTPTPYNAASTNYGGYIGGGLQSSHQPYM